MNTQTITGEVKYYSVAETAKLVRKALADKFPGVKFSVRSKSYSGGASIDVGWIDGPTGKQVEAVTDKFEGATFDGMIDLKSYVRSTFNGETVHFGADYIFCHRDYTVPFLTGMVTPICKKYGIPMPTIEASKWDGMAYMHSDWHEWHDDYTNECAADRVWRELRSTNLA